MRLLLSFFFAFSLLLTSAAGESASLPASCPQKTCCCGGEVPCCPPEPEVAAQANCGGDQLPAPNNCGRGQAPILAAQLPQATNDVEAAKAVGDPYARPWPAEVGQARPVRAEAIASQFITGRDGVLQGAPDRLSKLRILRI